MIRLAGHRFLFLALMIASAQLLPLAYAELGRDQANWLTVAMALEQGHVLYRDVAVVNTPGLGVLFWGINSLGVSPLLTPWVLHCLVVLATVWAGFVLLRAICGTREANGGALLLALIWPSTMGWWDIAQKDAVAFAFALGAMAFFVAAPDRRVMNVLAGLALAAAVFTKTSAVIYAVPAFVLLVVQSPTPGVFFRRVVWIVLGGLILLVPSALYLTWHEAWAAAKMSLIDRASSYGGFQRMTTLEGLVTLGWRILISFGPAVLLPLVLFLPSTGRLRGGLVLSVLLATVVFVMVAQGRGFSYHAAPAMAALGLILGACLGAGYGSSAWSGKLYAIVLTVAAVAMSLSAHQPRLSAYAFGLFGDPPADFRDRLFRMPSKAGPSDSREVAAWIGDVTDADDRIFVWGMESQIYIFANRMFVGPSFADGPIWHPQLLDARPDYFQTQMARFMAALAKTPPKVFVVARNDANPVEPMASDEALETAPALLAFVTDNYSQAFTTPHFIVYQLN